VLIAVGAVTAVCALVAIYQWLARDLFLNPELFDANQLHVYFRVNSIFFDPNILGRYLALAITAIGAYISWSDNRRVLAAALLTCSLLLAALTFSFSITSFAAVLAGLGMVAVLRWSWRGAVIAAAIGLVCLLALVLAGGAPTSDIQSDRGFDSGRSDLIAGGIDLAQARPLGGWGSGSFGAAFVQEEDPEARSAVSHSEPITVAAEQGVVGLVVYLALVAAILFTLFGAGAGRSAARTTVAACVVALLVHSLGYAGFIIDPATWALLGLGIALRIPNVPPASGTPNVPPTSSASRPGAGGSAGGM
jgi:O-antigen ligase